MADSIFSEGATPSTVMVRPAELTVSLQNWNFVVWMMISFLAPRVKIVPDMIEMLFDEVIIQESISPIIFTLCSNLQ